MPFRHTERVPTGRIGTLYGGKYGKERGAKQLEEMTGWVQYRCLAWQNKGFSAVYFNTVNLHSLSSRL